jgi:hypothetical protein
MNEDKEVMEDKSIELDVMPGADKDTEDYEKLDLSFDTVEEVKVEETEDTEVEYTDDVVLEEENDAAVSEEEQSIEEDTETVAEEVEEVPVAEDKPAIKPMVPKSRLDEVLNKQKALQKQLDDMKAAQQPAEDAPEEYNFSEKEMEYQNAVLDGEAEKAAQLRAEIRQAERAQIQYEMEQKMTDAVSQNQQANALQQAATALEAEFPMFDSKSDQYDEAMTQEVIELRDAFMIKGENAVAALSKAAKYVISENSLVDISPTLSGEAAPKKSQDEMAKKRAEVSRKLKAADSQPPEMAGEGAAIRGDKSLDINNLSEDEFNALPEATLKRLRGDIV